MRVSTAMSKKSGSEPPGPARPDLDALRQQLWQWVNAIPEGRVATYGQLAKLAGVPAMSRFVGRVMSELPKGTQLPWHRVISGSGAITNPNVTEQARRLRAEGVLVSNGRRVSLARYAWEP